LPRPCSICVHPQATAIAKDLIAGVSYRDIAGRFGISKSALERHRAHIEQALAKAQNKATAKGEAEAETLLDRLKAMNSETLSILRSAKKAKNPDLALRAIARLEKQAEIEGRLLGELHDHSGSGTGITVQVVYVNSHGSVGRNQDRIPEAERKIIDAVSENVE
jgi:transposase